MMVPVTLFTIGYFISLLIVHLHMQHRITQYHSVGRVWTPRRPYSLVDDMAWLPLVGGLGAILVGLLYLAADVRVQDQIIPRVGFQPRAPPASVRFFQRFSQVTLGHSSLAVRSKRGLMLRCLGAMTGIHYAVSKIPQTPRVLSVALLAVALAVYWIVDRTRRGLVIGVFVSLIGTLVCLWLTQEGLLAFVHPDTPGAIKSWVPVLLFASSVCLGSAARILAAVISSEARR
jgi:hypothetical protein